MRSSKRQSILMKMKNQSKKFLFTLTFLTILIHLASCKGKETENRSIDKTPELVKVPFGDPFIMLWQDKYYAYGTHAANGIEVLISDDLQTWSVPAGVTNDLALDKADVWADRFFWAPKVYAVNGKFYMYYSADEHICVATSDSPLGPFKQDIQKPMIAGEKCIDNSLFIDDDGKPYLFFDRFNDGLNIWVARKPFLWHRSSLRQQDHRSLDQI